MFKKLDYLNDGISPLIYKVFLPMLLASTVTVTTQIANTFFMGHEDKVALYIVGLFLPISFLMTAYIEGFQISNQVAIAIEKGRKNEKKISVLIKNFLLYGVIVSTVIAIVLSIIAPWIAAFFKVNDLIVNEFISFARYMVFANIIVVLNALAMSSLRGFGLVKISSLISVFTALSNILLVFLFVTYAQTGVMSIVWANLIVSFISLSLSMYYLIRNKILKLDIKGFEFETLGLQKLKSIGIPVALSYVLIFVSTFFFNKIVSPFGEEAIAGFGVAYRVQTMVLIVAISLGSAIGIIINQNIGGERLERAYDAYKKGIQTAFYLYLGIGIAVYFSRNFISSILVESNEVAEFTTEYLGIVALSYIIMGPMLTTLLLLEQLGKGLQAVVLNLAYFILIIAISWYLTRSYQRIEFFYVTISVLNVIGILGIFYGLVVIRKKLGVSNLSKAKLQLGG